MESGELSNSAASDGHQVIVIVLAVLFGVFGVLLLGLLLWPCLRRREPAAAPEAKATSIGQRSYKWGNNAEDDGSVAGQDPIGSPRSPPLPGPQTSSPPTRHNSGGPWSTSSVGGPGVQNMTGIGTSARNSHAMSYRQDDHQHPTSHFVASQGNLADTYHAAPYLNRNLNYPQI